MRKKKERVNIKKIMSEALEVPLELMDDIAKISIIGNREVSIQNYKGIIEYENDIMRINTKNNMIKIRGADLVIKNITDDEITIEGYIISFEYD